MSECSANKHVFINCPFDKDYKRLFRLAVFTIFSCGYEPRCAWELGDASSQRVVGIIELISQCRLSVHDLCLAGQDSDVRFNMPFELGMFVAARHFGGEEHSIKKAMVLHEIDYEYQKFLSDMAGSDFHAYKNDEEKYCTHIRNFLAKDCAPEVRLLGGKKILEKFEGSEILLFVAVEDTGVDPENIEFIDYMHFLRSRSESFSSIIK